MWPRGPEFDLAAENWLGGWRFKQLVTKNVSGAAKLDEAIGNKCF